MVKSSSLPYLADQEQGLDRLSKVISRQKDIAVTIGNEVDFQNGKLNCKCLNKVNVLYSNCK